MEQLNPPAIVGETVAGEAAKVCGELATKVKSIETSMFDVAELLHTVKKNGYHTQRGFNTLSEFYTSIGIKDRRARYLTRIVEVMQACGIPREQYEAVGRSKLRKITEVGSKPFNPAELWKNPESGEETPLSVFVAGFVEKHRELSVQQVEKHVRTLRGLIGDDDLTWLNVCVKRAALDATIRPALDLAKRNIGTVSRDDEGMAQDASDGAALETLAIEYLNDPANTQETA